MKPTKELYYDGEKLIYTYEYRGFKYTKEYKKNLKSVWGLKLTKIIDDYLDKKIYKITFEDEEYMHVIEFRHNQEYTILNSKSKKTYLN